MLIHAAIRKKKVNAALIQQQTIREFPQQWKDHVTRGGTFPGLAHPKS
jgi:hypothetical protein